ncbi:MAG TPA: alpha/beta hydrolase [Nocardioidaceae bacterium]|nr:alpha/beta hydrolase [Nocardioidaceae bacterium]
MPSTPAAPAPREPAGDPAGQSQELLAPVGAGVEICYQTFGDPADEPMLLVMGLGGPMTWWDPALCRLLAAAGFFVIRYDNRDTGRSTRVPGRVTRRAMVLAFLGRGPRPPYTLDDMAGDGFGVLDHLGIDSAHVVGISMGGMIAQTMAVLAPARVRSLTSIMSTTGRRSVGWQDPRLLPLLLARRAQTREAYIESSARTWRIIGSPSYPETREAVLARAGETFDRGVTASGVARQTLAILSQPDRSERLRRLEMPVLVIHGLSDKMVHVSGGRATSRAVPGSELMLVPGMGHDLPVELYDGFVEAIRRTASRSSSRLSR